MARRALEALADPDRTKFGPPDDTAILPWYEGAYTHAFVALSPFYTVEGLDPARCENGNLILLRSDAPDDVELMQWTEHEAGKRRVGKEIDADALDRIAARFGRAVPWRKVCRDAGFADHHELDRALRSLIKGLRSDLESPILAERLRAHCTGAGLFLPTEGCFEPLVQAALVELFRRAGHAEVVVGDEFGDDERVMDLALLAKKIPWYQSNGMPAYGVRRLFSADRSLFVWVHWDSFYIVILGTEHSLASVKLADLFEGFWCSAVTKTYWLLQDCIPLVD